MITETAPLQAVLDELRAELGVKRLDFAELVTLGAQEKLRTIRAEQAAGSAARERLVEMIRSKSIPVDLEAADEVKTRGLDPLSH